MMASRGLDNARARLALLKAVVGLSYRSWSQWEEEAMPGTGFTGQCRDSGVSAVGVVPAPAHPRRRVKGQPVLDPLTPACSIAKEWDVQYIR